MKCCLCSRSAPTNTLYRVNEKGVPGIWACEIHIDSFPDKAPSEEINQIVAALSSKQ